MTPSEKPCEELFISYAFLHATPKRFIFYAPTQNEENISAYDALFGSNEQCFELYLQFKSPKQGANKWKGNDQLCHTFGNNNEQLTRLRNRYPAKSAYYLFSMFWDFESFLRAQHSLSVTEILDCFIAVAASDIHCDTTKIWMDVTPSSPCRTVGTNSGLRIEHPSGTVKTKNSAYDDLQHGQWVYGSELLSNFQEFKLGCEVRVDGSRKPASVTLTSLVEQRELQEGKVTRASTADEMATTPTDNELAILRIMSPYTETSLA